ncbi:2-keto-4-pentenoate hydratase [Falsiroseomonas sp. CW058]|uniref:2-keto-4-pentenoate hydratase n=1 Tax=Falsiroseomonas sp. CW058 TaxID=3388664 RepID=UPI003D317100
MRRQTAILGAAFGAALLPAASALAACPSVPEVARLAAAILDRRPPPAPPAGLSMADALCARERLVAVLAQPYGDQVGWKIGLTNPAEQQRFGVAHPVAGAIFHGTLRDRSGAELPAGFGISPAVESDLLVRIRDEGVNEAGDDPVALLRHIDAVIPFIELPDLTYGADAPWSGPLLVSINVGARHGVLGEEIPAEATPDFARRLAAMTVVLADDTRELARAPGSVLLGHPLAALAWLVRDLKEQGRRLRGGEYVSLGGFSPALPVQAGRTYTATYEGLAAGPVSVSVRIR